jgi:RND family efflux transporter MFP subunit
VVKAQSLSEQISAPGEVVVDGYRTTKITPRITAQVVRRHARLGEHVKQDQPLVTLSSVEMAEAQGILLEAGAELRRVEKLGREVVSDKRFVTAQVAYNQAYAKVRAYGMTEKQIEALIKTGDAAQATGEFALLAFQAGTVISDDFSVGELIEPGRLLFQITDESSLRVKARLTPAKAASVGVGSRAKIKSGKTWLQGKVAQADHTLDESTRTLALYIEVANPGHQLHAGQFVETLIEGKQKARGIAVPLAAVLRAPDGDWQVFVETAPGRFEPKEVEVVRTVGDQMVIEGIAEGTTLVTQGAFFVQSEIAKSGFEVHDH